MPLTDAQHAALEQLDTIEVELRRSPFTADVAVRLRTAIDTLEEVMRTTTRRPRTPAALMPVLPEMLAALQAAEALCDRALPQFNWAGSALDAEALQILNDAPALIFAAVKHAQEATR